MQERLRGRRGLCAVQLSLRTGRQCKRAPSNNNACSQGKLPHVRMLQRAQEQQKPQYRELRSLFLTAAMAGPPLSVRRISAILGCPGVTQLLLCVYDFYISSNMSQMSFFVLTVSVDTCIGFTEHKLWLDSGKWTDFHLFFTSLLFERSESSF